MTDRTPKRPRDTNQLAKMVVDLAVGEKVSEAPEKDVVKRGRMGGQKGGPARAAVLTPAQRAEIAQIAAQTRWKKSD